MAALLTLAASGLIPLGAAAAAPAPAELAPNLAYVRVHSLADSAAALPAVLAAKRGCVLDLRHAVSTTASVAALQTALAARPADAPLFILTSPSTPADVFAAINAFPKSFVTLGVANPRFPPKVTVNTTAGEDRKAYDAFETGTPIKELISGTIEKERYDEATLVREFKNGDANPPELLTPDPTKPKTEATGKGTPGADAPAVAPLRDKVLQRALNVHQALLALRR